jgi:nitrous oxide reductase accessory protein NosL
MPGAAELTMRFPLIVALRLAWTGGASAGDYHGQATCDFCGMFMTEKAFGGRLTTTSEQELVFDASECMAAFSLHKIAPHEIRQIRSVNYELPSETVDARRAWYLRSDKRPSPRAVNLSAYAARSAAEHAKSEVGGEVLTWNEVVKLIRKRWYREKVD